MIVTGSLAVVLTITAVVMIRRGSIRLFQGLLCMLAGFEISSTSVAPHVSAAIGAVIGWFARLHL